MPAPPRSEILYTNLKAIATRLGVSTDVARRWIRHDGLPAFRAPRAGGAWFCLESSLCAWLADFERRCRKNLVNDEMRAKSLDMRVKSLDIPKR